MKRLFLIIATPVVIGVMAYAYWHTSLQSGGAPAATSTQSGATFPTAPSATQQSGLAVAPSGGGSGMTVAGISGQAIATSDFLASAETTKDQSNPGYYYLGVDPSMLDLSAASSPPYVITYMSDSQYFNIALYKEPIGQVREAMQQDLMRRLGITQDQMCQLNYMVTVPYWVNARFTGESLGFSFCPGAVVLPK